MRNAYAAAATAIAIGLTLSACSSSETAAPTAASTTSTAASTSSAVTTTSAAAGSTSGDVKSLIPAPADTKQNRGPDSIAGNGIHLYYQVNGAPSDVMDAYKTALEGKGWAVTTVVTSGGGGGGGGATFTGTNGDAYGVFDGGGFQTTTYLNVCAWPTKPASPTCNR